MTSPDYTGHEEPPAQDKLELLTDLAVQQQDLETKIQITEEKLKELGVQHRELAWDQIPGLMGDLNMQKFTLSDGYTIAINEKLRCSIPKDEERHLAAMTWIDANGGSALIQRGFHITFEKSQEKFARKFQRDCAQRVNALPMEEIFKIHNQTLVKFLGDKLEAGEEVPLQKFGGHHQRIAKITAPSKGRTR